MTPGKVTNMAIADKIQTGLFPKIRSFCSSSPPKTIINGEKPSDFNIKPINKLLPGDQIIGLSDLCKLQSILTKKYHGPAFQVRFLNPNRTAMLLPYQKVLIPRKVQNLSDTGGWTDIPKVNFQRARELRNQATPPETRLWEILRSKQLGIKFRSQHPIGPFIVDFYARQAGLVIEVDGDTSHEVVEQQRYDELRDQWMDSLGLRVRRYRARDVFDNLPGVVEDIQFYCRERVLKDLPAYQWYYACHLEPGMEIISGLQRAKETISEVQEMTVDSNIYSLGVDGCDALVTENLILSVSQPP